MNIKTILPFIIIIFSFNCFAQNKLSENVIGTYYQKENCNNHYIIIYDDGTFIKNYRNFRLDIDALPKINGTWTFQEDILSLKYSDYSNKQITDKYKMSKNIILTGFKERNCAYYKK